jgi:hypothetical protein
VPLPVSASTYSAMCWNCSASANLATAARCASIPSPEVQGARAQRRHADLRSAYVDQKLESDRAAAQVEKDALLVVQPNAEHATAAAQRDRLSLIRSFDVGAWRSLYAEPSRWADDTPVVETML